ncbi:MAG: hypothetical protein WBV66_10435, partial [Pseudolabrys sp.]
SSPMQISTRTGVVQAMAFPFGRIQTGGSGQIIAARCGRKGLLFHRSHHMFVMVAAITVP